MVAAFVAVISIAAPQILDGEAATQAFPFQWRTRPYDLRVEALPSAWSAPFRDAASSALKRYGDHFLLPDIALVSSFSLGGKAYGGTYDGNTVFIACDGADDRFVRRAVHHEYSSILLKKYGSNFYKSRWIAANPSEFLYGSGGFRALESQGVQTEINSSSAAQGFVSEYSKASLEEDFNLVAENLFEGGREFWRIVDQSPKLAVKVQIAVAFYEALDPALTEAAFRNHSQY
ncbi:MAG: hypothetical protein KF812_08190 [Fimbriimonadaceae bacterium]|nr:hypothetical protein [Fimbriimonadaceae bacterium]